MNSQSGVRRVIIVVLDGLRPDAIDAFGLTTIDRLMRAGASSRSARTIDPPLTTAALTSLMTGVNPGQHGITGDRVFIPRSTGWLTPMPQALADSGFPSAAFLAELPTLMRGIGARVGRRLGFGTTQFAGKRAADILTKARTTLLDVAATTRYALGVPVPPTYEGHPHADIFAAALRTAVA